MLGLVRLDPLARIFGWQESLSIDYNLHVLRELTSLFVPLAIEDDGYFRMKGSKLMAAQSKQTPSNENSSANDIELPMRKAKCSTTTRMHKILFIVKKSVEDHFHEDESSRFFGKFGPIYQASRPCFQENCNLEGNYWSRAVTAPLKVHPDRRLT
jgi:hypothetical protein